MADNEAIKELSEMRVEIKYMSRTLSKIEKVFEEFSWLMEKQNVANKRILELEKWAKICRDKVRILEDWRLKMITITTIIATVWSTIIWLILKNLF